MRESTITCPETIKKRNGTPVPFDIKKISSAIHKANDAAMVEALDRGLQSLSRVILEATGKDVSNLNGAGAAGGVG